MTTKTRDDLPVLTAEEAAERGYWTLQQVAKWAGLAVSTVYNLAVDTDNFPEPVAIVPSTGPNPHLVRDSEAVKEWGKTRPQPLLGKWTDRAEEITARKAARDPDVLSMAEVCSATSLESSTVWSYVRRTTNTTRGPMAHLTRPAYRVGQTPYWSRAQLDGYQVAKEQQWQQQRELEAALPQVTAAEAEERQWWSIRRLAEWAGIKHGTFHRRANEEGFPAPVAAVRSKGPRLMLVRDRAAVEAWLRARHPDWEPPVVQDAPQR